MLLVSNVHQRLGDPPVLPEAATEVCTSAEDIPAGICEKVSHATKGLSRPTRAKLVARRQEHISGDQMWDSQPGDCLENRGSDRENKNMAIS